MPYRGHVKSGVVVLDEPLPLPEGTAVSIEPEQGSPAEAKQPRRSSRGLWADLGVEITEKDIEEARREMYANFPREDIP